MTTAPITIIRDQPTTTTNRIARAAAHALWIAFALAAASILTGHRNPIVITAVIVMLTIGTIALAALRVQTVSARIDAAVSRILGR